MKSKEKAGAGEVGIFSNHAENHRQRVAAKWVVTLVISLHNDLSYLTT
jgi:hypothetical protein